ncbi:hypothetical protein Taro_007375, partial [Colocasia esculenta]|nr:hypothetical protein [Colocasia esculenta]
MQHNTEDILPSLHQMLLAIAVLDSLPAYLLSIFRIPKSVVNTLQSIAARLFWHGNGRNGRGWYDIPWSRVCQSKEVGGIGIRNIKSFNMALLWRWWSRLGSEEGVSAETGLFTPLLRSPDITEMGQNEIETVSVLDLAETDTETDTAILDGRKSSFWNDRWCGDYSLVDSFLNLFAICTSPSATTFQHCYLCEEDDEDL